HTRFSRDWSSDVCSSDLGLDLGSHGGDGGTVVAAAEDGRAGDEGVGAGGGDAADVGHLHSAVDLEADVAAAGFDQFARLGDLVKDVVDETLAAEARVDGHQQHHVDAVDDVLEVCQRGGRVEHQSGAAALVADQLRRAVDVFGGLGMEGDVRGPGAGEVGHDPVHRLDHEVHVDGGGDAVPAQGLAHLRADG